MDIIAELLGSIAAIEGDKGIATPIANAHCIIYLYYL